MSVDLSVYLARSTMPSPRHWADAIRAAGFTLDLDPDFDVDTFSGFLPCRYEGAASGFEYFAAVLTADDRKELELPAHFDFSVTLTTHSDLREFATSAIAAAVLCQSTGGLLSDPQAGETFDAQHALEWTRAQLAEIGAQK